MYLFYVTKKQTTTVAFAHFSKSRHTKKNIWHNVLSVQNEVILLVSVHGKELV